MIPNIWGKINFGHNFYQINVLNFFLQNSHNVYKMAKLGIMAQFQYDHKNWQKERFIKVYDNFYSNRKKIDQNI